MNTCVSLSRRGARLLVLACLSTPLLALASPAGDALARLHGETWVSRSFALSDLGFGEDVLLNGYDSRQEFYLPVPRTLRLADASIDFRGRYYKAEEGRTSMLLFVNGPRCIRAASTPRRETPARYSRWMSPSPPMASCASGWTG